MFQQLQDGARSAYQNLASMLPEKGSRRNNDLVQAMVGQGLQHAQQANSPLAALLAPIAGAVASGRSQKAFDEAQEQRDNEALAALMGGTVPTGGANYASGRVAGPQAGGADTVREWLQYANPDAVRNQELSPQLVSALGFLPEMGVSMEVFSGGQPGIGTSDARVGSTRHDHGNAADVFFYKDGRRLDWSNPNDVPVYQDIVRRARANGVTGFGAGPGYMRPGSMHIGFGNEAVWGAEGKGENAPGWLRAAATGDLGATPVGMGGASSAMSPGRMAALVQLMSNEDISPAIRGIAQTMVAQSLQQPQGLNPLQQIQLQREQFELAQAMNAQPERAILTDQNGVQRYQDTGDPVFPNVAPTQDVPAAMQNLDARARAGGLVPGTPEYQQFMLANGEVAGGAGASAREQEIARLMELPDVDRATAIKIADGVVRLVTDPVTGQHQLIDLSQGAEAINGPSIPNAGQPAAPLSFGLPNEQTSDRGFTASPESFGVGGAVRRGVNAAADVIGQDVPFPEVQSTQADFRVMKENLTNMIASAYARQPPSWLLQNISDLIPESGSPLTGASGAKDSLEALRRSFSTELNILNQRAGTPRSPRDQAEFQGQVSANQSAIALLDQVIASFDASAVANQTSSGVTWKVVE